MTASQIFDVIAPTYASDSDKTSFIYLAQLQTSETKFGSKYDYAVALRAAHMITLRDRGGVSGNVSSQKEGDLSISYKTPIFGTDNSLGSTSYGQQLLGLITGTIIGVTVGGEEEFDE